VKLADVSPDAIKAPLRTTIVDVVTGPSVPRSVSSTVQLDGVATVVTPSW
jgi:hypothetical protein